MKAWLIAASISLAIAAGAAPTAPAAAGPKAPPISSPLRIDKARIDRALAEMVSGGRAAGVSALILKDGREIYFGSAGHADREAGKPMRRDTLAQIWSMTKPVTGVALMRLWEQGRFGLDDRLADHLPEFAQTRVFAGLDSGGKPILKAPARPISIRDVLRHTAGFGYRGGSSYPEQALEQADPLNLGHDLAEFGRRLASAPLLFDPGTRWQYSAAVDVQALLVEKLSGMPFETYVRTNIFEPLGMKETGWTQPEARFARLARAYRRGAGGKLERIGDTELRTLNFAPRKLTMGGAGLVSSLDDYMRFATMLLNRGRLGEARILKPSTVRLMATDQLDPRITDRHFLPEKGNGGFGFDVFVRTGQPKSPQENRGAVGEFFWDGAWSTLFWVDPANNLAVVFFVQSTPYDGTMHRDIRRAVYGDAYLGPKGD